MTQFMRTVAVILGLLLWTIFMWTVVSAMQGCTVLVHAETPLLEATVEVSDGEGSPREDVTHDKDRDEADGTAPSD